MKTLTLIKQRRLWASFFGAIAFILPITGVDIDFNAEVLTGAVMAVVESISGLMTIILPLISYFKPKQ